MNCLGNFYTPQMKVIHRGKVRDSVRIDEKTRMIVVSDRISSFDSVLNNFISAGTCVHHAGGMEC